MNPCFLFYFRIYSGTEYFVQPCQLCPYSDQAKDRTPRNPSSILGKRSVFVQSVQTVCGSHRASYFTGTRGHFPVDTNSRLVKQINQSSRSTVEIKNEWSYSAFPLLPAWLTHGQFQSLLPYTYIFCRSLWVDFQTSICMKSLYLFLYGFITTLVVVQSVSSVVQYMAKRSPIRIHTCTF